jgi:hypothetical protein
MDGLIYKTDSRKVHQQLIHGFVQGEVAETWIKPKEKKQDVRLDYKALEAHYGGEGNKAVRIQESQVLRTTLHCKSERTMPFDKFLTNMQSMFTGFADNEEILTEAQKIRLLFAKVQSPNLALVKSNLQIAYDLDQTGEVTFDFIANSLVVEASKSPDSSASRNTSGVDTQGSGTNSAPESGVKGPDGVIFTGYYSNFAQLSDADKQTIFDERKRLGVTNGTILRVATKTPTEQELQTCPHVTLSSDHEWDPQNVRFPKASRTVEEAISRSIGSISRRA